MSKPLDLSEFFETFFDEADELLAQMEQLLLALDVASPDAEELNAIFRAAHSIKGGAATFGCFQPLTETTHLLENLLDAIRRGEMTLQAAMIDSFLETKDVLKGQVDAYRSSEEPDAAAFERACAVLRSLALSRDGTVSSPLPACTPGDASEETDLPLLVTITDVSDKDARSLTDEMENLGVVQHRKFDGERLQVWLQTTCSADDIEAVCCFIVDAAQLSVTRAAVVLDTPAKPLDCAANVRSDVRSDERSDVRSQVHPNVRSNGASDVASDELSNVISNLPPNPSEGAPLPAKAAPAARAPAAPADKESSSIRVGVEKVDQVINLVGELVITQSMLAQIAATLDPVLHDRLLNGMEQLERNARDLQESVMSIRMMPMDYVFSRFPRLVRDLASKMGKRIELETIGRATELDKSLIERIIDPLTHLVRNSLDHGIEMPDKRMAANKNPVGKLVLSAQHSGGNIVIEVSDDGAGLSRERLLRKAHQQNIHIAENASDDDVWQLIFAPGFSTAEKVTDISGRGVGMDVVRRNIQNMGGHVQLSSKPGMGTVTRIVLPLTLAILDGMSVGVGAETFILPLGNVTESLQPKAGQIYSVAGGDCVLLVRGDYLPLVEMHRAFGVPNAQTDPTRAIAVIMQAQDRRFALLVDHLIGQHQVVVKNLESNYRKVAGISAATILGDGSVALIVDAFALSRADGDKSVVLEAVST
jgi:two-component system chemotaxis sensor kinase CheA